MYFYVLKLPSGHCVRAYRPPVPHTQLRDSVRKGRPAWYAHLPAPDPLLGYHLGCSRLSLWALLFLWVSPSWHYPLYSPQKQLRYEGPSPGPLFILGGGQGRGVAFGRRHPTRIGYKFYSYQLAGP